MLQAFWSVPDPIFSNHESKTLVKSTTELIIKLTVSRIESMTPSSEKAVIAIFGNILVKLRYFGRYSLLSIDLYLYNFICNANILLYS